MELLKMYTNQLIEVGFKNTQLSIFSFNFEERYVLRLDFIRFLYTNRLGTRLKHCR